MPRVFRYSRPKSDPEEQLLDYLVRKFSYLTRAQWRDHVDAGHLQLNNEQTQCGYTLKQGDTILFSPPRALEPPVDDEHVKILYEDEALVVCVKNGNLPVSEGGRYCENTLVSLLDRRGTTSFYDEGTVEGSLLSLSTSATAAADTVVAELLVTSREPRVEGEDTRKRARENETQTYLRRTQKEKRSQKQRHLYQFLPVHRLDKETSGVVVLGKSAAVAKGIAQQFEKQSHALMQRVEDHLDARRGTKPASACASRISSSDFEAMIKTEKKVTKSYVAVLAGYMELGKEFIVDARIGTILEDPILRNAVEHQKLKRLKMVCYSESTSSHATASSSSPSIGGQEPQAGVLGKAACTRVRIRASDAALGISVADIDILTGRTHQIRVHCAHIGFPVLGDKLYSTRTPSHEGGAFAVDDEVYLARVRDTETAFACDKIVPQFQCRRHLLHSGVLDFTHPCSGEPLGFFMNPKEYFARDVRADKEGDLERLLQLL